MGLTQSAVSHQIGSLEEDLKLELFTRVGNKMVLTKDGKRFYDYVIPTLKQMDNIYDEFLSENNETKENELRIAGYHSAIVKILPLYVGNLLDQNPEKLVPLAITNLIEGKKVPIYGSGKNVREWIHVKDHCRAIAHIALNGKVGEIYNIGGRNSFQNLSLISKLLAIMGLDSTYVEFVEDRKGHDLRYAIDDSKLAGIGFKEIVEFNDGMAQTIQWYETNQEWWKDLK
jgi:UDP-glucose 4-epimerase